MNGENSTFQNFVAEQGGQGGIVTVPSNQSESSTVGIVQKFADTALDKTITCNNYGKPGCSGKCAIAAMMSKGQS